MHGMRSAFILAFASLLTFACLGGTPMKREFVPRPELLKEGPSRKGGSTMVTRAMRDNAIRNCERYPWARARRDAILKKAAPFLEMSDAALWTPCPARRCPAAR